MSRPPLPIRPATYAGYVGRTMGRAMGAGSKSSSRMDFITSPILFLAQEDAPLMTFFTKRGSREHDSRRRSTVFEIQSYVVKNDHSCQDRGENTIFGSRSTSNVLAPGAGLFNNTDSIAFSAAASSVADMVPMYRTKLVRDGSIIGYIISDMNERPLLKVHFHGNTKSMIDRTFKAFFRSPIPKWDVENHGLYRDMPVGSALGMIRDVYPDHRIFRPARDIQIPRLEMRNTGSIGTRYWLAVTDIPEPIGQVESVISTRYTPRSEQYTLVVRHCTKEEALLWLTLVIATDMKRHKVQNVRSGRPLMSPVFL